MHQKCVILLCFMICFVGNCANSTFVDFVQMLARNMQITFFGCSRKDSLLTAKELTLNEYEHNLILDATKLLTSNFYHSRHLFIVNLDCNNFSQFLEIANEIRLFAFPYKWIAFYRELYLNLETENNVFRNLSILADSEFYIVSKPANGNLLIRKIYKKHVSFRNFEIIDYGLQMINASLKSGIMKERKKLGITFKSCIVITNNDTFNHLTDRRFKHIDSISKVNYMILLLLTSIYDAKLNLSFTNSWGYKDNNSEWSGMMGKLVRREVDLGGTSLFLTKDRVDLIEYVSMVSPTRSKFVFRQPKLSYVTNVYVLPFDTKVWISTAALVLIMVMIIFLLMKWELAKNQYLKENHRVEASFFDSALLTIAAVCQQGAALLPFGVPARMAALWLYISLMFIYVSYSANIVALLQTSSNNIKTLEDLLNSRISVGVDDTVFNHFYFKTATEPIRKALYHKKVAPAGKPANFLSIADGVRKMRDGLYAFHMETGAGYKIVGETFQEDEKCGLQEIQFLEVVDPWFAIQKNSSYKELIKIGFRLLQESGIQQRENNLIYTKKPICSSTASTFFSVGIVDCYPAALILVGGIFIALAIFLLELLIHYQLTKY